MTFLHKLARRLARIKALTPALLVLSACTDGTLQEGLGPDPNNTNTTFVSLSIAPRDADVFVGDSLRLEATGWLATGKTAPLSVTWSAGGGSISPSGWFRPSGTGIVWVRAVATAKPSLVDSVRVSSSGSLTGIARLEVQPSMTLVPRGGSQQFVAVAVMLDHSTTHPTVNWSASGGSITPGGLFVASGTGLASVSATLGGGLASASSNVVIEPPVLTQLVLDPSAVTMEVGETRQLVVGASWSDGSGNLPALLWSVEGGTLSPQLNYTAGNAPGTYRVIVSSPTFARADTAVVTILPRLVGLRLTPGSGSLAPGATQPMQAFAVRNDGSEAPAGVQWSASGGTIGVNGTYTAGAAPGLFQIVATLRGLAGQNFSDTALMAITSSSATLTQLVVAPHAPSVTIGASRQFSVSGHWSDGSSAVPAVSWSASGGGIDAAGLYTAGSVPGTYRVVATQFGGSHADTATVAVVAKLTGFHIDPKVDTIGSGDVRQFSATLSWSDGQTHPVTISWFSNTPGGAISQNGVYSPGALVGSFLVVAACSCGAADTASVTVRNSNPTTSPTLMQLALTPHAVALALGGMQQFSPVGTWSNGLSGPVGVLYEVTGGGGYISAGGFFVAGNQAGSYRVIATQQGGALADTALVTVNPGPTLNQVVLNPAAVSVAPNGTQQFSVLGAWSDGSNTPPVVSYSATGGSIDASGLYTAGGTSGTYQVIATQQGGTLADTSLVTVADPNGPTLTQLILNPSMVTVLPGATQQFSVTASWSDGSSALPPLQFIPGGGTITPGGSYTAGTVPGTYQLIVRHLGGSRADTSTIVIPALTQLVLNPSSVTLAPGGSQLFDVAGSWSNGSATPPQVDFILASGGTISPAGQYVAGQVAGTYQVIAKHRQGTLADTSTVTISGAVAPPPPPPPPPSGVTLAELPRVYVNTTYTAPSGPVINVPAGGDLQGALDGAACGAEILLAPGARYIGNYTLPVKQCAANPVHLRTAGVLPPAGVRVTPAVAAGFAKLITNNAAAALAAASGARGYRVMAVELAIENSSAPITWNLVSLGLGEESTVGQQPTSIILDRVYIHANTYGTQRCVALNGVDLAVIDSWLAECHLNGFDAQAIAAWGGAGPLKIVNNYLEGSGENVLLGGADPRIVGLSPSDIEIRRNYFFKPLAWLSNAWTVKNLLELKNARRVLLEGNVLQNNWSHAQTGYGIVFNIISDNPSVTWTTVQDVTVRYNRLIASGNGIAVNAKYHSYETPSARLVFTDNLLEDIGRSDLRSEGNLLLIAGGPGTMGGADYTFIHNTMMHSTHGAYGVVMDGAREQRLTMLDNVFTTRGYAFIGTDVCCGTLTLNAFASPWDFRGNVFVGHVDEYEHFPTGNFVVAGGLDAQGNLSGMAGKASDGGDPGANVSLVMQATNGVIP